MGIKTKRINLFIYQKKSVDIVIFCVENKKTSSA